MHEQPTTLDASAVARFAVILESAPRLACVHALTEALTPYFPELTPIDVRQRCRYAAGILESGAPRAHAEALVEALVGAGYQGRLVPAEALVTLAPPARVRKIRLTEDGVVLDAVGSRRTGARAGAVTIRFDELDLVLAFALDRPRREIASLTADQAAAQRAAEDTPLGPDAERLQYALARYRSRERRDAGLGIDLVRGEQVFRIERDDTIWPDSGSSHSLEAFVWLGRRLLAAAPGAADLPENRTLLDGLLDTSLFQHPEELRRYERWLLWRRSAEA